MSKVYSFRLDENNPREAQAREVIEAWVGEGHLLRYIVTEALINFHQNDGQTNDYERNLEKIIELLEILTKGEFKSNASNKDALSKSFIGSVAQVAKPGIKISE